MSDTQKFGSLRLYGEQVLIRLLQRPEKIGSIYLPGVTEDTRFKSMVGQVLAIGPGGTTKTKYRDHWFPGKKKWGIRGDELPVAKHNPRFVGELEVGMYIVLMHPFIKGGETWVEVSMKQADCFSKDDLQIKDDHLFARCYIIPAYEAVCEVQDVEDEGLLTQRIMRGEKLSIT